MHRMGTAAEAVELGLDVTGLDAHAIHRAVQKERGRRFTEENAEHIAAHNAWVEEHGLPLARYRMF